MTLSSTACGTVPSSPRSHDGRRSLRGWSFSPSRGGVGPKLYLPSRCMVRLITETAGALKSTRRRAPCAVSAGRRVVARPRAENEDPLQGAGRLTVCTKAGQVQEAASLCPRPQSTARRQHAPRASISAGWGGALTISPGMGATEPCQVVMRLQGGQQNALILHKKNSL